MAPWGAAECPGLACLSPPFLPCPFASSGFLQELTLTACAIERSATVGVRWGISSCAFSHSNPYRQHFNPQLVAFISCESQKFCFNYFIYFTFKPIVFCWQAVLSCVYFFPRHFTLANWPDDFFFLSVLNHSCLFLYNSQDMTVLEKVPWSTAFLLLFGFLP